MKVNWVGGEFLSGRELEQLATFPGVLWKKQSLRQFSARQKIGSSRFKQERKHQVEFPPSHLRKDKGKLTASPSGLSEHQCQDEIPFIVPQNPKRLPTVIASCSHPREQLSFQNTQLPKHSCLTNQSSDQIP